MILADKISTLRKKNGWSQEELAEKLNVTRQAVSKWEGAQTVPDLDKILQMSRIFGVSTDYLIKDEIETEEYVDGNAEENKTYRVSLEEANRFLENNRKHAKSTAFATFLCIISPICLILLGGFSQLSNSFISENAAGGIGLCVLFLLIAAAVAIFISGEMKMKEFEFLEKNVDFSTEYGVTGLAGEGKKQYADVHTRFTVIGTVICILGVVPLFLAMAFSENDIVAVMSVSILLLIEAIGVSFLIISGIINTGFEKLLCEGDYTKEEKKKNKTMAAISTAYWLAATAIFLAYSFITDDWKQSWIIWAVAGVLYGAVASIVRACTSKG